MSHSSYVRRSPDARHEARARRPSTDVDAHTDPLAAIQRRANAGPAAQRTSELRALLDGRDGEATAPVQRMGSGGLPADVQAGIHALTGDDLSGVRVQYGSRVPARYQAHAVTQGNAIHVAPGQERHVAHEAWHAVQQRQGRVRPTLELGGTPVNDDPALEHEADVMGARAASVGRASLADLSLTQRYASNTMPLTHRASVDAPAQLFLNPLWRGVLRGASLLAGAAYGAVKGAAAGGAAGSLLGPVGATGGAIVGGVLGGVTGGGLAYTAGGAALDVVELKEFRRRLRAIRERAKSSDVTWQDFTDGQTRDLDALEHDIYTWLDENRFNPATRVFMPKVLNVLDGVQAEHRGVIDEVHTRNLDLWTPDRESLGGIEQGRLQQAWNALRNDTGLIQGGGGGGQGPEELRAMHARLLSRPGGRRLLYTLLDMQHGDVRNRNVAIEFTPADTRSASQKAQVRALKTEQKRVAERLRGLAPTHPDYEDLMERQMDLVSQIDIQGGASDAAAASAVDKPNAGIYGTRLGSASNVKVRLGTRDSDDLAYDRLGRAIPSPAFLQYGHELIHALHFRNAQDRSAENFDAYRGGPWSDREEHHTIEALNLFPGAISENELRAEHGISARYGHTGTSRDEHFA